MICIAGTKESDKSILVQLRSLFITDFMINHPTEVGEKGYVLELSNKIATEITLLLHKMI
jgi:hypothetical protein